MCSYFPFICLPGRYRSGASFIADVKHVVEDILLRRANSAAKDAAAKSANLKLSNKVMHFLRTKVEAKIDITL